MTLLHLRADITICIDASKETVTFRNRLKLVNWKPTSVTWILNNKGPKTVIYRMPVKRILKIFFLSE